MSKTGEMIKGMGIGMMVGCAAGVVGTCCIKKNKKGIKHNAGKALHSFGSLMESITDMF